MKRIIQVLLIYTSLSLYSCSSSVPSGYVDLGLPSGTLWKATNEIGFYDYGQARNRFGKDLPTLSQIEELRDYCKWFWTGNGYKVLGNNGQFIVLPASGLSWAGSSEAHHTGNGYYWFISPNGANNWFFLNSESFGIKSGNPTNHYSVRLVKSK